MFKFGIFCLLFFNALSALEPADRAAIVGVIEAYTDSWNKRECVGFADHYADDADFVNIFGMKFSGRSEIERRHVQILQGFLKGSQMETLDVELREAQPGLVIATAYWRLKGFRNPGADLASPGETREGVFTHVFLRANDKWEIASSQNTLKPIKN